MKKTVLTFGLIAGAVLSVMMVATMPFLEKIGFERGAYVGYTTMVLAFLLVFFGVRSYRDTTLNGKIGFWRAVGVGLLIVTVAAICYVITWEILYFNFLYDFGDKYLAFEIQRMRSSGKPAAEVETQIEYMRNMMNLYKSNIFVNLAITFLEPLPVGVPMTFLSALILRTRRRKEQDLHDLQDAVKETSVNPV